MWMVPLKHRTGAIREYEPPGTLTTVPTIPDSSRRSRGRGEKLFKERESVVLTADVSGDEGEQLRSGDVGTVIHVHAGGEAFVVEFMALDGDTVAIATVLPSQARPVTSRDLTHTRQVEPAVSAPRIPLLRNKMPSKKTHRTLVIRGTGPRKAPPKVGDLSKPPGARGTGRANGGSSLRGASCNSSDSGDSPRE